MVKILKPRLTSPLLIFMTKVIDGADGARFTTTVSNFGDIRLLSL